MPPPVQAIFCQYRGRAEPAWLYLDDPVDVIQARHPADVLPSLATVEEQVERGLYAAGFLSYEAAPGFDTAMVTHPAGRLPLLWFALFRRMRQEIADPESARDAYSIIPQQPSITPAQYQAAVERIKDYIARGHTWQVNYTFRLRSIFRGDPWPLFHELCVRQRARYNAYLDTGDHVICSASPELFFTLDAEQILTRPMKGTAPRGLTVQQDQDRQDQLAGSPKDRAENAMIVDMMRNDLGRIARPGSVRVLSAFDVEIYPTVLQMTSTIAAKSAASLPDIFKAMFPPASITGAPKIRTMEIIRELEPDPRGIYTGCIGLLMPGRKAQFNVAIRTLAIDRADESAEYGVGSGIVWDSDVHAEYAECHAKTLVLTTKLPQFELLETILYDGPRGCFLLNEHLQRLAASADYFDFPFDPNAARARLDELTSALGDWPHRLRLRVDRSGQITLESTPLLAGETSIPWRLTLAAGPISDCDVFLYHKTTCRTVYETARAACPVDCDDVVLWNERNELTETTIANLVIQKGGQLLTPPVACGLLPGVFRKHLLDTGQIQEQVLRVDDLWRAEQIFAVNSVRKWRPAIMVGKGPPTT